MNNAVVRTVRCTASSFNHKSLSKLSSSSFQLRFVLSRKSHFCSFRHSFGCSDCFLRFPASHSYVSPLVNVIGLSQASKPPSPFRRQRDPEATEKPVSLPSHALIQRRVRATALSDCLQLSTKELRFQMYSSQFNAMKQGAYCDCQEIILINNSKKKLHWQLDLRDNVTLDDDIFRVLNSSLGPFIGSATSAGPEGEIEAKEMFSFKVNFTPRRPGTYRTRFPLYVNHNHHAPYTYIELSGELIMPSLIFEPRRLILPPVPLNIESIGTVRVRAKGFEK